MNYTKKPLMQNLLKTQKSHPKDQQPKKTQDLKIQIPKDWDQKKKI